MITLEIIKYDNANALEATWKDGEQVVKCHSYADIQMDMLRADALAMGTALAEFEPLISSVTANIAQITIEQAKVNKINELLSSFNTSSILPIKVGTKYYNGGKESAQAIRDYIQLVSESGGTEYSIWDTSNVISTYTLTEATSIKLAIATAVVQAEFNLRNKKNAVDLATSVAEVEAVVW